MDSAVGAIEWLRNELLLFAAIGLLIGGLDDLLIDLLYVVRRIWRSLTIYSRVPRMTARGLPPAGAVGPIAVFVPAWDEADVIAPMLAGCLDKWRHEDVQIFVGVYPNDRPTAEAVFDLIAARGEGRISLVFHHLSGPTTKADCLNELWRAMLRWETARGREMLAVVLHDAEDVVHRDAPRVIGLLAPRFALVQLPVLPLTSRGFNWVSGHYCDEFAEAHGKSLLVREALGASLPSAGVGCGFNRQALGRIAAARDGLPFDAGSLTEDYELGLRLGDGGGRGILVRMRDEQGGLIATREYFPDTLEAAIRQKTRWTIGIALAGWDRLGWSGPWRERWMRLRDRRAAPAAIVLAAAYLGFILSAFLYAANLLLNRDSTPWPLLLAGMIEITIWLLIWRLFLRMVFVWRAYGLWQALLSLPRTLTANAIALMAARRAMRTYLKHLRGEALTWDKTAHRFPNPSSPGGG